MDLPSHLEKPKLCLLRKWETFVGYGFNLHSEKGKPGQFIGKVDPESPAFHGGLNANDVLIEVNGVNVEDASHSIAVGRVKSIVDRVDLFVCHPDTYKYCRESGIKLSSAMHTIDEFKTPMTQPPPSAETPAAALEPKSATTSTLPPPAAYDIQEVKAENLPERFQQQQPQQQQQQQEAKKRDASPQPPAYKAAAAAAAAPPAAAPAGSPQVARAAAANAPGRSSLSANRSSGDPVGNVSLEDVRAKIGQNRRNQVKMTGSSFSEKYSMFEAL